MNGRYEENTQEHPQNGALRQVGSFFVGVLVGSLAGSVGMLLLAPQSGQKTRTQIQRKGVELRDQVAKTVKDATAQVRTKARQVSHDVQEQAEALQQRGQDMIDEQRDHLGQTLKGWAKAVQA